MPDPSSEIGGLEGHTASSLQDRPANPTFPPRNNPKKRAVVFHTVLGAAFGYFIIHPITMVIYLFEFMSASGTPLELLSMSFKRVLVSFTPDMLPMGLFLTVLGAGIGLGQGIYARRIAQKNKLLERQEKGLNRNLATLIAGGENQQTEFKETLRWDLRRGLASKTVERASMKTLAGFMNSSGGVLLIGVDDGGDVKGLELDCSNLKRKNLDGFEQYFMQCVAVYLGADLCAQLQVLFHTIQHLDVCGVYVDAAARPVYLEESGQKHFYLRTGNNTRKLNIEEAANYIAVHWQPRRGI